MCYLRASFTPYTSTSLVLTATHYQGAMQAYAALGDERRYPGESIHTNRFPHPYPLDPATLKCQLPCWVWLAILMVPIFLINKEFLSKNKLWDRFCT